MFNISRMPVEMLMCSFKIGVLSDGQSVSTFSIPSDLQTAEVLTLKIAKGEKRITPHVYEVRILKE